MSTALATTPGTVGWGRTIVLTLGMALLGLTLLPSPTSAMTDSDVGANVMFQIALCEAGGGTPEYEDRSGETVDGDTWQQVTCKGGIFDGMKCQNTSHGVSCVGAYPKPVSFEPGSAKSRSHLWQLGEVIPILESSSLKRIDRLVADVDVAYDLQADLGPSLRSADDHQQDHHAKPKAHKHGKNGGRGHR